ncbi:uncharacterized protein LOC62_01G000026 [Vanrija pseudolonga]|uniref:F-box domain-containing protein n=1 Tax=Vanrija pseudolonga TaxID=143232 RepID=A0AAF0Y1X8_9TREE|nr:hypothetical protein LOC62_01G000026 [Vanrija pseudolonga]
MPPDPLTRFDNFIVGEIFSKVPLHDITLSLYNVSRGWRQAVVSTGALKTAFLNQSSLSMQQRRRLKAQGGTVTDPQAGPVDWRHLALDHLRQEQAWVTGKPRVEWLRQVYNPDNIVFHSRVNDEGDYYLGRLPWLTPEGFDQPKITLVPVNLHTMAASNDKQETRTLDGVRTEYRVIGRMLVYTPRPRKGWAQIWVTETAWNDFGARERSFIAGRVEAEQHEDSVFDGLKCLATFPVRTDIPHHHIHITTSADLQHFDVYVVSDMKDRSHVYRLATTGGIRAEGLIHDIEHLPVYGPLEVSGLAPTA